MTGEPLRVVVADDHAPTRAGVRAALEADGFAVVGEAATGRDAVELVRRLQPDVSLLDIHMPGGSGIEAAATILREQPDAVVVVLTYSRDEDDLFDALRAGAGGYLVKDMDPDRLGAALRGVLAGDVALPRSLMARVVEEFRGRTARRTRLGRRAATLTSREWEVAELLRQGVSTEQIAERLFVSPVTVRVHVRNVLRKLRVPDRAAAVRLLNED